MHPAQVKAKGDRRGAMTRRLLLVFAAALLTSALSAAVVLAPRGDTGRRRASLRGSWGLVRMVVDGCEVTDGEVKATYRLTFQGDRYAVRVGGRALAAGRYATCAARPLRAIDITPDEGRPQLGVYRLEGDALTVYVSGGQRPARIPDSAGGDGLLLVLRRECP
jgi:uncharacterized protein (TIGR03067 family)